MKAWKCFLGVGMILVLIQGYGCRGHGANSIAPTPPEPPANVVVTPGPEHVAVTWSPVSEATSYNIYWSMTAGVTKATGTRIADVTSPYTHTGLIAGTSYYYVVTASNSYGESKVSLEAMATPSQTITPDVLVTGASSIADITVDSASVYWVDSVAGDVKKVLATGGTATTLASTAGILVSIATDSANVYWSESGAVMRVGLDGGTTTPLASGLEYLGIGAIAVNDSNVYWACKSPGPSGDTLYSIQTVSITGGSVATLASGTTAQFLGDLVTDGASVYWTVDGELRKVGVSGGTVTVVATDVGSPGIALAVDGSNVYWAGTASAQWVIKKVSINGGAETTLATVSHTPMGMAADATHIYWTETGPACSGCYSVKKVGINGGTVTVLAAGLDDSGRIAIDADNVYWEDVTSIKKVPKSY